jgi:hypothetical protein
MSDGTSAHALQRLLDKDAIRDAIYRYARGVDRSDFELVRSTYHPGAYDDHGDFKGTIEEFIPWLQQRLADDEVGMHHLGNCLIEFESAEAALVETYFVSQRLRPAVGEDLKWVGDNDLICRQRWGRYVDRFEKRDGDWRVASRTVVFDAGFNCVALGGGRRGAGVWGRRDSDDFLFAARSRS